MQCQIEISNKSVAVFCELIHHSIIFNTKSKLKVEFEKKVINYSPTLFKTSAKVFQVDRIVKNSLAVV